MPVAFLWYVAMSPRAKLTTVSVCRLNTRRCPRWFVAETINMSSCWAEAGDDALGGQGPVVPEDVQDDSDTLG